MKLFLTQNSNQDAENQLEKLLLARKKPNLVQCNYVSSLKPAWSMVGQFNSSKILYEVTMIAVLPTLNIDSSAFAIFPVLFVFVSDQNRKWDVCL